MNMKKIFSLMLFIVLAVPLNAGAEDIIKKDELLNLQRCVEIAVMRHPTILAGRNNVSASQSRVGQAKSNYYPQIDLSGAYSRIKPITGAQRLVSTGIDGTSAENVTKSFDQFSGSVSLSQNIYDFGRTSSQVDIQKFNLDASRSNLETTIEQVVFDVKQAYYGVLRAQRNRVVAQDTVKQFQLHLDQAKAFYEVGTRAKYDVTKAEVDLSNAKLALIRSENTLKVSKVTLNNTMGVPDAPDYAVEDNLAYEKYEIALPQAIETAYKNRPDLKAAVAASRSFERSIDFAKTGYYPVLTGNAQYDRSDTVFFPSGEGWSAGVALTFPIFNGFLTKNQVEEAKANLGVAKANEETLRQSILLDVQQEYLNLVVAAESISNTGLTVKQATENLDIANGRYAAGVGNPIEVSDAEVSLAVAKTGYNQALYDYKVARASLERAMGVR
ncbi:MAG: TolC family protein [Nitrospiraceae bacterium]|nr:TolC family protein [Nitrospiraceae bacterium]